MNAQSTAEAKPKKKSTKKTRVPKAKSPDPTKSIRVRGAREHIL